jgi:hypothetical protein
MLSTVFIDAIHGTLFLKGLALLQGLLIYIMLVRCSGLGPSHSTATLYHNTEQRLIYALLAVGAVYVQLGLLWHWFEKALDNGPLSGLLQDVYKLLFDTYTVCCATPAGGFC